MLFEVAAKIREYVKQAYVDIYESVDKSASYK
jgi:hypothetical protein